MNRDRVKNIKAAVVATGTSVANGTMPDRGYIDGLVEDEGEIESMTTHLANRVQEARNREKWTNH